MMDIQYSSLCFNIHNTIMCLKRRSTNELLIFDHKLKWVKLTHNIIAGLEKSYSRENIIVVCVDHQMSHTSE